MRPDWSVGDKQISESVFAEVRMMQESINRWQGKKGTRMHVKVVRRQDILLTVSVGWSFSFKTGPCQVTSK